MTADDRHDDPTHALDDFMRRMRPAPAPPAAAPDLADLVAKLHTDQAVTPGKSKGGVLRSGQRWDAGDVEDVPVIELPRNPPPRTDLPEVTLPTVDLAAEDAQAALSPEIDLPPVDTPPPPDLNGIDAATRHASDFVSSQWDAESLDQARPVWQPDAQALQLRPAHNPRVLAAWQPGAWSGAVREVFDSTTEFVTTANGPAVETYPPHRLLLLWPPLNLAAPLPGRWPRQVRLSAAPAHQAADLLLALMPDDALLWLQPEADARHAADWALAADILLHHASALRPFQITGLRAFIDAEREASFARLNADYHQPVAGGAVVQR